MFQLLDIRPIYDEIGQKRGQRQPELRSFIFRIRFIEGLR